MTSVQRVAVNSTVHQMSHSSGVVFSRSYSGHITLSIANSVEMYSLRIFIYTHVMQKTMQISLYQLLIITEAL